MSQKILIIHPGGIGDLVMFTPAIKILKDSLPDSKIDIFPAYTPEAGDIFKEGDIINRVFRFNLSKSNLLGKIRFFHKLRREKYDISILPTDVGYLKGGILSFIIGAKIRIGESRKSKGRLLYTHVSLFDENKHLRETNIALLKLLGLKIDSLPLPFLKFDEEKEFADSFLAKNNLKGKTLVGLHPSSGGKQDFKRWPRENFLELGKKILSQFPNVFIVLFGGPGEEELCFEIKKELRKNVIIIVAYPLRQVAALIDKCQVFIASDCGLGHIASTTSTNLISIFGPTDPNITGPIGKKVHIIKEKCDYPYDRHPKNKEGKGACDCLKRIKPERVFDEVKKIL